VTTIKRKSESETTAGAEALSPAWRRELFATILANIDDGISVQDREMRIIYANAALKRTFGDDLEGRYCYQIYERRSQKCLDCPVDMAYRTGKPYRTTHHAVDKHGDEIAADIVATPVFDENGEIVAGVEVARMVTEQLRAQQELLQKTERLERLAAVAREISSGLDLGEVLRKVVENAAALTGADAGTVALLDKKNRVIRYPYHFNMPAKLSEAVVPEGAGIAGQTMTTGEPVILEDYPSHPAQVPVFTEAGVKAILAVPLMIGKKPVGALGLFGKSPQKKFSKTDLEMALAVADQAAVAIENANLFRETSERLRVQRELNRVAISITSGLDLSHVLQEVARHASEMVNADAAMIALLNEEEGTISFPYAYNLPQQLCRMTGRLGNGIAGQVIEKCEPRIDNDYQASDLCRPDFVEAGVTGVASVPLMIAGRCIGAIGVMDKGSGRKFTDDDINILTIVSRQAAAAAENANLYEELARSAQRLEQRVQERTDALSRMYQESERKSRELEAANLKLREVDRMKSEFLANMSHELRTPLNSIIGFSKLILDGIDGEVNEEQKNDIGIVHTNGLELLRLIDDLLNLAKIEAGRVNLILDEASPGDLVEEAVMSMRAAAGKNGLKLEYTVPEELRPVKLDAGKIRQVLLNLIGNAVKFTEAGRIDVAIEQSPEETVFSVKDTGIGISPEQIEAIFNRFHQAAPGEANSAGVGLGLTISKRLVEMHKGRVWVKSEPGKGSIFSFSIPHDLSSRS
jgi:PAS domain S-box-containing protein